MQDKKDIQEKECTNHGCEKWIGKSVPLDHCLSLLGKPRDVKYGSSEQHFYRFSYTNIKRKQAKFRTLFRTLCQNDCVNYKYNITKPMLVLRYDFTNI